MNRKRRVESNFTPTAKKRIKIESAAPALTVYPSNERACRDRYKTFSLRKWNSKPKSCNAWECARHGWMCVGKNTLKCVACGAGVRSSKENLKAANFQHKKDCTFHGASSPKEFSQLPPTKVQCQELFIQNLKTFNTTDGKNNFFTPTISEETRATLIAELPESKQSLVTDAMLLAACGWQLRDRRRHGGLASSEHLRISCSCCERTFPLTSLRLQTNPIIPSKTSALDEMPKGNHRDPFSIDNTAPTFGQAKIFSRVSFWEEGETESLSKKRKIEDDLISAKKPKIDVVHTDREESNTQISTPGRKRSREDQNENQLKKRKLDVQESIVKKREAKTSIENDRSKRRKTASGFKITSPRSFDPLQSHRPSCPFVALHSYSTGNGETPGFVHCLRSIKDILTPALLQSLINSC